MLHYLASLLSLVAAEAELRPGVQLHFSGTVAQVDRGQSVDGTTKNFDLTAVVTQNDAQGLDVDWLVDERGAGSFGWLDRFGRWTQTVDGSTVGQGPALLYDYGTGKHAVELLPLRAALPAEVDVGATWSHDGLEYEVLRTTPVDDRRCWEVEAKNSFGPRQKLWVDAASGLVVRYEARVFMNQGTEYKLATKRMQSETLDAAGLQRFDGGIAALVAVRDKLKRAPRKPEAEWTPAQRKALAAALPPAKQAVHEPALERLVAAAERDLNDQSSRADSLDQLTAKQLGRAVAPFSAAGLGDTKLTDADLRDRVTVLHFWDYRDAPLHEPYGQVGYLEFLHGRRKEQGLRVVGVAVDGRFRRAEEAATAAAGVRRLRSFMNLTYPIVHDDGELLNQFGDPRTVGGAFPLFVVVGPDGKVVHYKVGHYAVDRQAGLKELDDAVQALLEKSN